MSRIIRLQLIIKRNGGDPLFLAHYFNGGYSYVERMDLFEIMPENIQKIQSEVHDRGFDVVMQLIYVPDDFEPQFKLLWGTTPPYNSVQWLRLFGDLSLYHSSTMLKFARAIATCAAPTAKPILSRRPTGIPVSSYRTFNYNVGDPVIRYDSGKIQFLAKRLRNSKLSIDYIINILQDTPFFPNITKPDTTENVKLIWEKATTKALDEILENPTGIATLIIDNFDYARVWMVPKKHILTSTDTFHLEYEGKRYNFEWVNLADFDLKGEGPPENPFDDVNSKSCIGKTVRIILRE